MINFVHVQIKQNGRQSIEVKNVKEEKLYQLWNYINMNIKFEIWIWIWNIYIYEYEII